MHGVRLQENPNKMSIAYKLLMLCLVILLVSTRVLGGEPELQQAVQEFEGKQENPDQLVQDQQVTSGNSN